MKKNEIRIHYATHFLKLSLWYVRQLMENEGTDFFEAMNGRVNVYRNTCFYKGGNKVPARGHQDPAWDAYLIDLKAIYDRHYNDVDTLEDEGLAFLWPKVKKEHHPPSKKGRPYECWTFDEGEDNISIHIANVYQPQSPLSDMRLNFVAMLLKLLRDVKTRRPEVVTVGCGSWMNSIKPFQEMFPQSWHDDPHKSPKSGFGMGHWGQFMDRTGRFHMRNGQMLRETGDFPYASLWCQAPLDEVVTHIETHFPEVVAFLNDE